MKIVWPRFTVGSITGYAYMEQGRTYVGTIGGDKRKPRTTWHVYDRLFNYAIVGTFDGRGADERASHNCRRRNGGYARWLRLQGLR